ncbi:MAG: hypothetical protein AAFR79_20570 [Pseudomonadota bacterium]
MRAPLLLLLAVSLIAGCSTTLELPPGESVETRCGHLIAGGDLHTACVDQLYADYGVTHTSEAAAVPLMLGCVVVLPVCMFAGIIAIDSALEGFDGVSIGGG